MSNYKEMIDEHLKFSLDEENIDDFLETKITIDNAGLFLPVLMEINCIQSRLREIGIAFSARIALRSFFWKKEKTTNFVVEGNLGTDIFNARSHMCLYELSAWDNPNFLGRSYRNQSIVYSFRDHVRCGMVQEILVDRFKNVVGCEGDYF